MEKESEVLSLNVLKRGESAVIKKILGSGMIRKRYIEMGMTSGQPIKLMKVAPLGDPIEIEIRKYRLSLRRSEAENVIIEKIEPQ